MQVLRLSLVMLRAPFIAILVLFLLAGGVAAQNPTKWILDSPVKGKAIKAGEEFEVKVTAAVEPGWYLYGLDQPEGGPIATRVTLPASVPFELIGTVGFPPPKTKEDQNFIVDGKPLLTKYYENSVEFTANLKATQDISADVIALDVRFQLCDDRVCLPPRTKRVSFAGEADVRGGVVVSATPDVVAETTTAENQSGEIDSTQQPPTDLWPFVWLAMTLGALSLLTPCVFPMIPITVSYFTNHASGSRAKAVRLATIYSLGIIATFTLLGMLLAIFVGAAGINLFAANPWINILIAGIFLFFAFNLFGAYEITIPSGILTRLDGLTRSSEGDGSGVIGALLMGLTFTLTSFTCTSPFVGTILVAASQGDWQMPLLGMLAFSTVFALPFFILALVPQWASSLPRAGGWMNSVKVSMGFLEVAAAMKFISNVDVVWKWGFFTREVVLAVWVAIGVTLTVYLLGKFQLSHDSKPERIGAFRLASAVISLAISFYLLTGLFGARLGELEAFLPPDISGNPTRSLLGGTSGDERLQWIKNDYEGALAKAKAENKRLFVDFTGYTCTNCRWMEANVFPKAEVEAEFRNMVLASLYTDGSGEIYEKQQMFQESRFKTVALPFYAILDGDGKVLATFPGLTRNVPEFVDFLKKGQQ